MDHAEARAEMAAAFRWTAREDMHEGVANHFSFAVNDGGTQFLINPKHHFSTMKASDLWVLDADDPDSAEGDDAPDQTAWGLHGSLHRHVPHARCAMHVHSTYATVLASLADSRLPAIDQNSAIFHNRQVVDENYGGLALEDEGTRCARMFQDPSVRTMIMGNHGVLFIGETVAETFMRMYYFERAARNYIIALSTGQALRRLSDEVAERTASQMEEDHGADDDLLRGIRAVLDRDEPDYAN
ncbi:class II aldolase and adducin N-terminal domain-containing protein [Jannaschia sp. CCS1]|uniref:class II aldolase and adducin N-terminal domain-containing protein n=1 Tax=Jannaschia sp. (strain CCS1) TaxID=290400 RepID=UPI000053B401|nr:class II aldolase and adducin N-terminal domain-containing protein [Jannaschia sp. CCS1]ABD53196.1 class II aldolase/adducin-like protein [Jannaschia sp. CCS1]